MTKMGSLRTKRPRIALLGILLFCAQAWLAGPALAADERVDAVLESHSAIENFRVNYWGNYAGPQLARPGSQYTTDYWGGTSNTRQNADDNLTLGYQTTPAFRPGIGIPFNFVPTTASVIQIKPIYFGVVDATLFKSGNLSIHSDARIYLPIGDMATVWDTKTGFRTSQFTTFEVPGTHWTLGAYNYFRVWVYGPNGHGFRNDTEIYFSPFAWYRFHPKLSFTLWSDVLQLGHQFGKPWGLSNLPVDVQPGIRWDITQQININPYLNFIPGHLAWDTVNVGMVVNARLL